MDFFKEHFDGIPVPVRFKLKNETIEDSVEKIKKSITRKKKIIL
jgi:hypothetical protein